MTPQTAGVARLHRVHQPRGRPMQQKPGEQEREVDDVEVERVQRLAAPA